MFLQEFLTNALNPKATLFFLSLFTQVINPETPTYIQIIYGLEMGIATFIWFSFVALVLSRPIVQKRFKKIQNKAEKFFGAVLLLLGIKVVSSN